jgi:hypothetical protein
MTPVEDGVFFYDGYLALEGTLFGTMRQEWGLMVKVCFGFWGYCLVLKKVYRLDK